MPAERNWSGSAQTALWGLEAGLLSVIDLDYHTAFHRRATPWNMALTAINVAKVQQGLSDTPQRKPFSMTSVKTLHHNRLLIEQLFSILPKKAQLPKNHPQLLKLYQFGAIAALFLTSH